MGRWAGLLLFAAFVWVFISPLLVFGGILYGDHVERRRRARAAREWQAFVETHEWHWESPLP